MALISLHCSCYSHHYTLLLPQHQHSSNTAATAAQQQHSSKPNNNKNRVSILLFADKFVFFPYQRVLNGTVIPKKNQMPSVITEQMPSIVTESNTGQQRSFSSQLHTKRWTTKEQKHITANMNLIPHCNNVSTNCNNMEMWNWKQLRTICLVDHVEKFLENANYANSQKQMTWWWLCSVMTNHAQI